MLNTHEAYAAIISLIDIYPREMEKYVHKICVLRVRRGKLAEEWKVFLWDPVNKSLDNKETTNRRTKEKKSTKNQKRMAG
jgi:hypothetical protein